MQPPALDLAWSVADAAAVLGPRTDAELLSVLADWLGIPEIEPGKYDAGELLSLHDAIAPFLRRRDAHEQAAQA